MGFDLSSAKPITAAQSGGGFDLSSAKPVQGPAFNPFDGKSGGVRPAATANDVQRQRELASPERTWRDDTLLGNIAGVPDAAMGVLSSMATPVISVPGGFIKSAISGGDPEKNASDIAERLAYKPTTGTGQQILRGVGAVAEPLGALPSTHMLQTAQAVGSAAPALRSMAGAGAAQIANRVAPAAEGLSSMAKSVVPKIDPKVAELAGQAQKYDIPLRPDMLYGNKIAKMLGEASEKVPLSGAKADARQAAFNKAVITTIGGEEGATKLTPDVFSKAITQSGEKIGEIAARSPLPIDAKLTETLKSHLENAMKFETSDVQRVVASYIEELNTKAVDGIVPGEAVRKLNTKMSKQMRSTTNGDLKNALGGLQDDIQDAVQTTLSGRDLAELQAARRQYAIAKNIEPLVAKSATGDISPAGLMARMTSDNAGKSRMARGNGGDIGDLARIGQKFLKEPNSSGTAERGLAYGLAGGGVVAQPAVAGGVYGAANLYNRAGNAISNKLIQRTLGDMTGDQ